MFYSVIKGSMTSFLIVIDFSRFYSHAVRIKAVKINLNCTCNTHRQIVNYAAYIVHFTGIF